MKLPIEPVSQWGNGEPQVAMKYCPDCKKERPVSEFYHNKARGDGLTSYCRKHHKLREFNKYHRQKLTKEGNPVKLFG